MRLLIVGSLGGEMVMASKIAMNHGAKVGHADDIETALTGLRAGHGADLIMVDVNLDIAKLVAVLESERFSVPVVACGIDTDKETAVRAIKAGAREFIPLPPNAELIAAVLEANHWNKSQSAGILRIERSTLDRKIKRYKIVRERESSAG